MSDPTGGSSRKRHEANKARRQASMGASVSPPPAETHDSTIVEKGVARVKEFFTDAEKGKQELKNKVNAIKRTVPGLE